MKSNRINSPVNSGIINHDALIFLSCFSCFSPEIAPIQLKMMRSYNLIVMGYCSKRVEFQQKIYSTPINKDLNIKFCY